MKVLGKKGIQEFQTKHADIKSPLSAWVYEAEQAQWLTPSDIKARYPHASLIDDKNVVFNLKGNSYRLHAMLDYERRIVLVKRIGTHAEYSKWKF